MSLHNTLSEFAELLLSNENTSELLVASPNMCIYREQIKSVLIQSLQTIYPLTARLMGIEFFYELAHLYSQRYPASNNLHDYGEYFSDFLADHSALKSVAYLNELAQLEWCCHSLEHAQYCIKHFRYPILRIIELAKGLHTDMIDPEEGGINLLIHWQELDIALVALSDNEYASWQASQDSVI